VGNRFFVATAMSGRLYPEGIADRGPWDCSRLVYWPEEAVRIALRQGIDRVARTAEDLEAVVRNPEQGLPAIRAWIQEGLEGQARTLWREPTP
jgi:hypothetical protein